MVAPPSFWSWPSLSTAGRNTAPAGDRSDGWPTSSGLLPEIEQAYGWPKDRRIQSYAALRTILHALRDRLTVQVAAQLPLLVRGTYYDGWNPNAVQVRMDREEFLTRIRQRFRYSIDGDLPRLIDTVLQALRNYVTHSEWHSMRPTLPKDLATVLP